MANSSGSTPLRRANPGGLLIFIVLALTLLVVSLAANSPRTIVSYWEGGFPSGVFHLKIRNENDDPISGAALNVFDSEVKSWSFYNPIYNYVSYNSLLGDEEGMIVAWSIQDIGFGGTCWKQFWIHTVCSEGPKYDIAISAEGYKTLWFSTGELFAPAYNDREIGTAFVTRESGEVVELPVYELLFVLK
jgi:hypothetical protein